MKIPANLVSRDAFYKEIIDQCFESRSNRMRIYARNRDYNLFGTIDGPPKTLNKIGPHIALLSAYLFSAETTRFMVQLGQQANKSELLKIDPMVSRLMDEWHDGGVDAAFGEALEWSLNWDSTFIYLRWKKGAGIVPYVVAPHDIGVYREDVTSLKRQEAIAMRIRISKSQLEWELKDRPNKAAILKALQPTPIEDDTQGYPQIIRDVIASSVQPNITGVGEVAPTPTDTYQPVLPPDMILLYELRMWDDDLDDWRLVTQTESGTTIYDRKQPFIPHELPLVQVRPKPMIGYFWGGSEVSMLIPLQDALAKRIDDISHLLNKQVKPSYAGIGLQGDEADIRTALDSEYGWIPFPDAGSAKIETLKPDMPQDAFAEVREFERLFNEASGIPGLLQGQGQPGVRSKGQTDIMARLGSGRIKKRAMIIEESLDDLATLMLKMIQAYDERTMRYVSTEAKKEVDFVASQFTGDFTVKVDSHSMSPVFIEDNKQLAFELLEAGVITKERLVEMISPMMKQQIKEELKVIDAAQQQQKAQEQQAEIEKEKAKHPETAAQEQPQKQGLLRRILGR